MESVQFVLLSRSSQLPFTKLSALPPQHLKSYYCLQIKGEAPRRGARAVRSSPHSPCCSAASLCYDSSTSSTALPGFSSQDALKENEGSHSASRCTDTTGHHCLEQVELSAFLLNLQKRGPMSKPHLTDWKTSAEQCFKKQAHCVILTQPTETHTALHLTVLCFHGLVS